MRCDLTSQSVAAPAKQENIAGAECGLLFPHLSIGHADVRVNEMKVSAAAARRRRQRQMACLGAARLGLAGRGMREGHGYVS